MPLYEYRCRNCGITDHITCAPDDPLKTDFYDASPPCQGCVEGQLRRVFSFTPAPVLHEHWNPSTGTVISSHRQHRSELRRISEESEARTGIPTNLVPADPRELRAQAMDQYGDDGLKSQHDAAVARGEKPATGKIVH